MYYALFLHCFKFCFVLLQSMKADKFKAALCAASSKCVELFDPIRQIAVEFDRKFGEMIKTRLCKPLQTCFSAIIIANRIIAVSWKQNDHHVEVSGNIILYLKLNEAQYCMQHLFCWEFQNEFFWICCRKVNFCKFNFVGKSLKTSTQQSNRLLTK